MNNIFFELVDLIYGSNENVDDFYTPQNREPINFYDVFFGGLENDLHSNEGFGSNQKNGSNFDSKNVKAKSDYFSKLMQTDKKDVPSNSEKSFGDTFQNYLFKHMIENEYDKKSNAENKSVDFNNGSYSKSVFGFDENFGKATEKNAERSFENTFENTLLNTFLYGGTDDSQKSSFDSEKDSKSLGGYKEFLKSYYERENTLEKSDKSENFLNYFLYSNDDDYKNFATNSSSKKSDYNKDGKENKKTESNLFDDFFGIDERKKYESDAVSDGKPYVFFWDLEENAMSDNVNSKYNKDINSEQSKSGYNDIYFGDYVSEKYGNSSKVNTESLGGFKDNSKRNNPFLVDNLGNNEDVLLSKIYQVLANQGSGASADNASRSGNYNGDISVNISSGNYEVSSIMNEIGSKLRQAMQGSSNKSWYS